MKRMFSKLPGALAIAGILFGAGNAAADGALDGIRTAQSIRIAYREDAPPFSFKDSVAGPTGFIVDLCRAVVDDIRQQLALPELKIAYVPVSASDRFEAITQKRADILCEPTTSTLSRREQVDFSLPTFVDGAGIMLRNAAGIDTRAQNALAGKNIGYLSGTTTEQEVQKALKDADITATVVPVDSHATGLAMLDDGRIDAYFADWSILSSLQQKSKAPDKLRLLDRYYSIEPYALALPHGDEALRLAVDRALSHLYRSGRVSEILKRTFGDDVQPSNMLVALYMISGLPD
jgi:ABC-type amino acid transport substrate-binding protein